MNQVQIGYQRDRAVVAAVTEWRAMTAEQVRELLFPIPAGLRKAQQRLKRLYDQGRVGRMRLEAGYCYYAGTRPGQADHLVAVNWARLWLIKCGKSWEALGRWEYEPAYAGLRADAVCIVRNKWTEEHTAWFVELDRSHNAWTKAGAYNELYASGKYDGAWWVPQVKKFPAILCAADDPARLAEIRREIGRSNPHNLRFEVRLLADLIDEVRRR